MKQIKPIIRSVELSGRTLTYELYRGSYQNINLRVRGDGTVRVSASRFLSVAQIEELLRAKEAFLLRSLDRVAQTMLPPESPWRDGGAIPILGKDRLIRVSVGEKTRAILDNDEIAVTVRENSETEIRRAILRLLESEAKRVICDRKSDVERTLEGYGVPAHEYRFRYMVSRWGSCCPTARTITFNKYLICVPPECIEYVMVHETAHFTESNHSPAFWRIVGEILPDWKKRKQRLTSYGVWLRALEKGKIG